MSKDIPHPHPPKPRTVPVRLIIGVLLVLGIVGGGVYWQVTSQRVYIDKSVVSAPQIDLSPHVAGILRALYVRAGDTIPAHTPVALVGNEVITSDIAGLVITVKDTVGTLVNPGQSVVSMLDPNALRVEGRVAEDKGLKYLAVGQRAIFEVDAYGNKQYTGIVDEVSPASRASDIIFNISDKRQVNEFTVKVRFDRVQYPELKNGMSAYVWVYH